MGGGGGGGFTCCKAMSKIGAVITLWCSLCRYGGVHLLQSCVQDWCCDNIMVQSGLFLRFSGTSVSLVVILDVAQTSGWDGWLLCWRFLYLTL